MYRVYRGIIQPHKQALLTHQISIINHHSQSVLSKHNYEPPSSNTYHWRKCRESSSDSSSSMISDHRSNSVSSNDSTVYDPPQRNMQKRVTFSLNPILTIHEISIESEGDNVFEDTVITNTQ